MPLAFANEYDMNLLYVSGSELISKYTFDWERECGVLKIFKDVRNAAPCVIFFHHFDALAKTRGVSSHKVDSIRKITLTWNSTFLFRQTSDVEVVCQLAIEIDDFDKRKPVYLLASANRRYLIDEALLRPKRIGKTIWVDLPDVHGRLKLLELFTKKKTLASDVSLEDLARRTQRFR